MVINGDVLSKIDFNHLIKFHNDNNSDFSICVKSYKTKIPYGIANLKELNVINMEEKPILEHFINAGIYFINPKVLKLIKKNKFFDMTNLIELSKNKNLKVKAFLVHENWQDIGAPEIFLNINKKGW